jgi:type II secretory pathway component PulF
MKGSSMPTFKYKVRDRAGKAIDGTIDAPTPQMAGDQLYQLGYLPVSIEAAENRKEVSLNLSDLWKRFQKVKPGELIIFSQQLSTLYKAGLPLLSGLESLREQTGNTKLKEILEDISRQIEAGSTLFASMSKYPKAFSSIYINMVRAGETSGRLGESLDRFVALADRELSTRQRVKEATRYPKIVLLSLLVAFGVLLVFVIPRFAQVFSQFKTPLPLPTRMMIGINDLFQHYWFIVLGIAIVIPIMIRKYLRTEKGEYLWDRLKIRIPLVGPLFLKIALSRFAYTFSMLNASGIPILQTLEITASTIGNVSLARSILDIGQKIKEGRGLADAMKESGRFTPLVIQMVSVGESSGSLDGMLARVTESYDIEVDNGIKKMGTYIEPLLTLFLGVAVLFLALAVFLPWWNMASLFR